MRGQLRQCAGEGCALVYLDTSRGRRRRWCSSEVCGNRARVARHRRRAGRTRDDARDRSRTRCVTGPVGPNRVLSQRPTDNVRLCPYLQVRAVPASRTVDGCLRTAEGGLGGRAQRHARTGPHTGFRSGP
ncbi:CGNR zinc finger domain-containing protein [Streptomyces albulus]|nr:CGNR zinc finger domain-containing protein [Streptomyces noursei]